MIYLLSALKSKDHSFQIIASIARFERVLLRDRSVKGSSTIMDDKRDFKPRMCISEEPKCNNSEINHAAPYDRNLHDNYNNNNNNNRWTDLGTEALFFP
jgi:hypothetical protein